MITFDLTWTVIFSSLASMSFTQDMLRYVASQVQFSGVQLDDRGGSRPLYRSFRINCLSIPVL